MSDGVNENICGFDTENGCSMCTIGELDRIGVKALKIVGRERNYANFESS